MSLRYVILRHDGIAQPHFDLMFETAAGSALATWRSDVWPIDRPTTLTRLADHRCDYLDYEGPVSNNRGHVMRVEGGRCRIEQKDEGAWRIEISGARVLSLRRVDGDRWQASVEGR